MKTATRAHHKTWCSKALWFLRTAKPQNIVKAGNFIILLGGKKKIKVKPALGFRNACLAPPGQSEPVSAELEIPVGNSKKILSLKTLERRKAEAIRGGKR